MAYDWKIIHRWGIAGNSLCGKLGNVSSAGIGITCPECIKLEEKPSKAAMLAELERQARIYRKGCNDKA